MELTNYIMKLLFKGTCLGFGIAVGVIMTLALIDGEAISWEGIAKIALILVMVGVVLFGRLVYTELVKIHSEG